MHPSQEQYTSVPLQQRYKINFCTRSRLHLFLQKSFFQNLFVFLFKSSHFVYSFFDVVFKIVFIELLPSFAKFL